MKKIVLLFGLLVFTSVCFGQSKQVKAKIDSIAGQWKVDDNGNVTYQRVVDFPNMKKDDIYNRALAYFVYNYGSGKAVIQTQDKDGGIIIAKGIYDKVYSGNSTIFFVVSFQTSHILKIECKDEKARITLTLVEYEEDIRASKNSSMTERIGSVYPVNSNQSSQIITKNAYGEAFYASHKRALSSLAAIEKAINEGNTAKEIEDNN